MQGQKGLVVFGQHTWCCTLWSLVWMRDYKAIYWGPISDDFVNCWTLNWLNSLCCEVAPWAIPDRWCCCSGSNQVVKRVQVIGFFSEQVTTQNGQFQEFQISSTRPRPIPRPNVTSRSVCRCIIDWCTYDFLLLLFSTWYILCLFLKIYLVYKFISFWQVMEASETLNSPCFNWFYALTKKGDLLRNQLFYCCIITLRIILIII